MQAFILAHLDEDLDTQVLSKGCHLSQFHFHRLFVACTGMTARRYIQFARLKRASLQLVFNRQRRIIDIALDAGFEYPESFARAFRRIYGQSPSRFRRSPDWEIWWHTHYENRNRNKEHKSMQVHIVNFPETRVAALEHHGPESRTYDTTRKFIEWRQQNRIGPDQGNTYGIHYTDPKNTFPEDYRLDICVSVEAEIADNPQGVVNKIIPACRCAVVRHKGSREHVTAAEYLVFDWLPQSGEALGEFPIFFHYVNVGPDVPEHGMITDVYLPIR
jgi:AraC family transcriptional regulator